MPSVVRLWTATGGRWGPVIDHSAVVLALNKPHSAIMVARTVHAIALLHHAYRFHVGVESPLDDIDTMIGL